MSIGFGLGKGAARRAKDGATELLAIDLHEVSLVLVAANPRARVLVVKRGPYEDDDIRERFRRQMADLLAEPVNVPPGPRRR